MYCVSSEVKRNCSSETLKVVTKQNRLVKSIITKYLSIGARIESIVLILTGIRDLMGGGTHQMLFNVVVIHNEMPIAVILSKFKYRPN